MCDICVTTATGLMIFVAPAIHFVRSFLSPKPINDGGEVEVARIPLGYKYVKGMEKPDYSKMKPSNGDASRAKLIDAKYCFNNSSNSQE